MTAITGNLSGSEVSAEFTPTNVVSDLIIVKNGGGYVSLRVKAGDITTFQDSLRIEDSCSYPISTSDSGVTYILETDRPDADFDYYLGP